MTSLVSPDINFSSINQILTEMNGKNPFADRVDLSTNPKYSKVIDVALNYLSQHRERELNGIHWDTLSYVIEKRRMAILLLTKDEVAEVTNACGKDYSQLKKETVALVKKLKDLFVKKGIKIYPSSKMLADEEREIEAHKSYIRVKVSRYSTWEHFKKIEQIERLVFLDTFNILLPLYFSHECLFLSIQNARDLAIKSIIQTVPNLTKGEMERWVGTPFKELHLTTTIALQTANFYLTNVKREDLDRKICEGIIALTDYLEKEMEKYWKAHEMWKLDPKKLNIKTLLEYEYMKPHVEKFENLYIEITKKMEALGIKIEKKA